MYFSVHLNIIKELGWTLIWALFFLLLHILYEGQHLHMAVYLQLCFFLVEVLHWILYNMKSSFTILRVLQ